MSKSQEQLMAEISELQNKLNPLVKELEEKHSITSVPDKLYGVRFI